MLKKYYQVVISDEKHVDEYIKLAANNNLCALYKIGVYGKERQHELHISGKKMAYLKFMRDVKELEKKFRNQEVKES